MKRKPAPFRVVDMLIGAGCYDLNSERAAKNGAWRAGVVRLLQAEIPDELAPFFSPLLDTIRRVNAGTTSDEISLYPGSPVIAAKLIRPHVVVIPNARCAAMTGRRLKECSGPTATER